MLINIWYDIYVMCNVVFLDYKTLFGNDANDKSSFLALKDVVNKFDNIRIVLCINTNDEMKRTFDYNYWLDVLSQGLNLKKSLFFDVIHLDSWNEVSGKISSWMSVNEVKAFAIVVDGHNISDLASTYANNVLCCDIFSEAIAKNVSWILSNYKNNISNEDDRWFTSDTHFFHKNIIRYCNRPWNSGKDEAGNIIATDDDVKRMNDDIVARWNSVVSKSSIVWHLGDFSFGGKENLEHIFPKLNGKINLVMGNHDHNKIKYYYDVGFHRVYDKKVLIHDFVILTHAPLMFLNENTPFFQIFGHVHDSLAYPTWSKTGCCACVERHDYYPISWKTIKQKYDEMNNEDSK